jgi:hypothetical protein
MNTDSNDDLGTARAEFGQIKSPYDLDLHETTIGGIWELTRVPGGWIYRDRVDFHKVAVFVPDYPEPEAEETDPEDQAFTHSLVKCLNDFLGGQRPEIEANRLIRTLLRKAKVEEDARS